MQDLGALPGDVYSAALDINDSGDVVGVSLDESFNSRTFLLHRGVMIDLSDLISPDSPLIPLVGISINAGGEIAGLGLQESTGELHAFLATPKRRGRRY